MVTFHRRHSDFITHSTAATLLHSWLVFWSLRETSGYFFHFDFCLHFLLEGIFHLLFVSFSFFSHLINHVLDTTNKFFFVLVLKFWNDSSSSYGFLEPKSPTWRRLMIFFEIQHGTSAKIITEIKSLHNALLHFGNGISHFGEELMIEWQKFDWWGSSDGE